MDFPPNFPLMILKKLQLLIDKIDQNTNFAKLPSASYHLRIVPVFCVSLSILWDENLRDRENF